MGEIKEYGFFVDENNQLAQDLAFKIREILKINGIEVSSSIENEQDLLIVFGGDGTMLKAAHVYKFQPIFLGINCGHRGYLMNDGDASEVADRILNEKFEIHRFPLLKIEGDGWKGLAMNDVYFNRIAGQTCKVNVKVNGVEIAQRISGDGIVICTALGSTGYFVPAGGSAINPKVSAIGLAPITVNTPIQFLPMIFPLSSQLEVTLLSPSEEVKGWYDGIELPYFQRIKVKKGNRRVKLAFWEGENFTKRQAEKIMRVREV